MYTLLPRCWLIADLSFKIQISWCNLTKSKIIVRFTYVFLGHRDENSEQSHKDLKDIYSSLLFVSFHRCECCDNIIHIQITCIWNLGTQLHCFVIKAAQMIITEAVLNISDISLYVCICMSICLWTDVVMNIYRLTDYWLIVKVVAYADKPKENGDHPA